MSEITNPPLEPAALVASRHTSGPIVNPPLDDSGAGGSAAVVLQNPPLDPGAVGSAAVALQNPPLDDGGGREGTDGASADNPPLSSISNDVDADGLNPPLDETDIERWFEQQLGQGAPLVPPAKKPAAKKPSPRKRASKSVAEKRSNPRKPAKKQASRRRSVSKDSRAK
jgi:hypothetical protein